MFYSKKGRKSILISLSSSFKLIFTILIFLGSIAYPVGNDVYEKEINLLIVLFGNASLIFVLIASRVKIPKPSNVFLVFIWCLVSMSMISIVKNSVIDLLPSLNRYLLYILVFLTTYKLSVNDQIHEPFIMKILVFCIIVGSLSGFIEILTDNVRFVNGAYRVAGNFNHHHLGYALYLYVPLICIGSFLMVHRKVGVIIIWVVGFIFFSLSQSRSLLLLLVVSLGFVYWVRKRGIFKKVIYLVVVFSIFITFLFVVYTTSLFPRLKELLVLGAVDPSTQLRFYILTKTISGMENIDILIGVGLGGFNSFFYQLTGMAEIAAHNDYLLMFTEGGFFAAFMYMLLQYSIIKKLFEYDYCKNNGSVYLLLSSIVLFLFLEVCGFLLNAHYFYQSQIIVYLVLGFTLGKEKMESKKEELFLS